MRVHPLLKKYEEIMDSSDPFPKLILLTDLLFSQIDVLILHATALIAGTPDSPNGIDYELYVTKKVWSKTVGGDDVTADRIFHYHQVCSVM